MHCLSNPNSLIIALRCSSQKVWVLSRDPSTCAARTCHSDEGLVAAKLVDVLRQQLVQKARQHHAQTAPRPVLPAVCGRALHLEAILHLTSRIKAKKRSSTTPRRPRSLGSLQPQNHCQESGIRARKRYSSTPQPAPRPVLPAVCRGNSESEPGGGSTSATPGSLLRRLSTSRLEAAGCYRRTRHRQLQAALGWHGATARLPGGAGDQLADVFVFRQALSDCRVAYPWPA